MSKPRTGAPKRVAVGLLAGALAMFGVALAPQAGASASVTTDRLAGTTRYGTAQAISASTTFTAPTTAIVATGENFPDALAASTLAGANVQAPIVLTETGVYTPEAKAALAALKAKGVSAVTIVGGTSAVAQSVEDAIKADGFTVTRVAGDDRYETAAAIATAANTKSAPAAIGSPALKTALIATGLNSPDALAAGPAAAANKLPLLLVNDTVPAETSNAIATLGIKKVVILGGTAAVSSTVEAQLVAATGNPATRLAGINRYSTATGIADYEKATLAFPMTSAVLANGVGVPASRGGSFSPDALAGGPLGGVRKSPVLLTADPLSTETAAWLDANSATLNSITAVGGTAVIPDTVLAAAKTSAQNVGNDSANKAVTTRPELTGAQVLSTTSAGQVTPTNPIGTKVRYTFDETLGSAFTPVANLFKVWSAANAVTVADSAAVETGTGTTGTTVVATFNGITDSTVAAGLTKATVAFEAVRDAGGAGNPEGEASIGTAGTTPSTPGATSAADLKTVGNFRQASTTGSTAVDFTFDQAAFTQSSSSAFHLVDVNATDTTCTGPAAADTASLGGQTIAGGNGTTTITVVCGNVGGATGPLFSASNVARGYVLAGSIGTAALASGAGVTTPQEAADVAGSSLGPDLVSVSYVASTGTGLFTFDAPITAATGTNFYLYNSSGGVVRGDNTGTAINSTNPTQVSVAGFGTNVTTFVGGGVFGDGTPEGSTRAVRTADARGNQPDEEGFAGTASTTTPGRTSGPDLTAVALSATTDAFGNTNGYAATYTFDVAATTAVTVVATTGGPNFHLYLSDGTRWNGTATGCVAGDGTATSTPLGTVKCSSFVNSVTGSAPSATAPTTLAGSVVGTVSVGAVLDAASRGNSEGAAVTSGGTGTPAS